MPEYNTQPEKAPDAPTYTEVEEWTDPETGLTWSIITVPGEKSEVHCIPGKPETVAMRPFPYLKYLQNKRPKDYQSIMESAKQRAGENADPSAIQNEAERLARQLEKEEFSN